jgi:hypothetical protein
MDPSEKQTMRRSIIIIKTPYPHQPFLSELHGTSRTSGSLSYSLCRALGIPTNSACSPSGHALTLRARRREEWTDIKPGEAEHVTSWLEMTRSSVSNDKPRCCMGLGWCDVSLSRALEIYILVNNRYLGGTCSDHKHEGEEVMTMKA